MVMISQIMRKMCSTENQNDNQLFIATMISLMRKFNDIKDKFQLVTLLLVLFAELRPWQQDQVFHSN